MREWREFEHLAELPCLEDLVFIGNALEEEATVNGNYTQQVSKRLLLLKKLDGYPIIREEEGDGAEGDGDAERGGYEVSWNETGMQCKMGMRSVREMSEIMTAYWRTLAHKNSELLISHPTAIPARFAALFALVRFYWHHGRLVIKGAITIKHIHCQNCWCGGSVRATVLMVVAAWQKD